jgi:hypothetical protein
MGPFVYGQAMHAEHTLDNGAKFAAAIFFDMANLFVRLPSILGSRKD